MGVAWRGSTDVIIRGLMGVVLRCSVGVDMMGSMGVFSLESGQKCRKTIINSRNKLHAQNTNTHYHVHCAFTCNC